MVAIMSVLLMLTLVTTISLGALATAFAEGEEEAEAKQSEQTEQSEETDRETSESDDNDAAAGGTENGKAGGDATSQQKQPDQNKDAEAAEGETAEGETTQGETGAEGDNAAGADADSEDEGTDGEGKSLPGTEAPTDEDADDGTSSDMFDTGLKRETVMPTVTSSSYTVISGSTSEVVVKHHSKRKMQPGHLVFLLTAMVVIDNMHDDRELTNTVEFGSKLAEYGFDFKESESVPVGDLIDAMLVGGSEQAAEALASYSASTRKIFIREMNSKAMELGLMDTQITNPSGAYDTKQYSTASDIAVIAQAAMRYPLIRESLAKRNISMVADGKEGHRSVTFSNANPLMMSTKPSELYNFCKGGLMGTMGEPVNATQFVGIATIDDMQLIVVLMDSEEDKIAYESKGLFQYADTKVTRNVIVKAGKKVGKARVRGGVWTSVAAYTATKGFAYVPPEGSDALIQTRVVLDDDLTAPLRDGDKIGEYRIYVADELKGTVDLIIRKNIDVGWPPSQIFISNAVTVGIGVLILLILLLVIRIIHVKKRRQRRRAQRRKERLEQIAREQLEMDEDRKKRNWDMNAGYDKQLAPRTSDLRKEAVQEAMHEENKDSAPNGKSGKPANSKKKKKQDK